MSGAEVNMLKPPMFQTLSVAQSSWNQIHGQSGVKLDLLFFFKLLTENELEWGWLHNDNQIQFANVALRP